MFFQNKIISIRPGDKVLEIGPGANPHSRSDVLLEMKYSTDKEYEAQFGHKEKLATNKQVIYYDGSKFPFADKSFNYIICSHVLEHVPDLPSFLSEVFRVADKGYFEYPLIYYEYLYNFPVHLNILKFDGETLYYKSKSETHLNEFKVIQDFFYNSLQKGHVKIIDDLLHYIMEGFEWNKPFNIKHVLDIKDLVHKQYLMPIAPTNPLSSFSSFLLLKQLVINVIRFKK